MAFKLITGKMGGGKSYWGAEIAIEAWKENAIVHSNLAFKDEWLVANVAPDSFVRLPEDFSQWRDLLQPGAEGLENVLIVDEGAILFNARDFNKNKGEKDEVFTFMVHARKLGLDIYFISQSAKNVDAQLRRMADAEWQCMKTRQIPVVGLLLEPIFGMFRRYKCTPDGQQVLEATWAKLRPEVYEAYATDALHGKNLGLERNVRRTKSTEKKWSWPLVAFLGAVCAVAVGIVYGFTSLADVAADVTGRVQPGEEKSPLADLRPPVPVTPEPARPAPAPAPEPEKIPDLILSARGRTASGAYVIWLREWGMVRVGTRLPWGRVTSIIRENSVDGGSDVSIVLDNERTLYTRLPRRSDNPNPQQQWKTFPISSGPPASVPSR